MKLYQYDDLKKANQALGSFKRNGINVVNVSQLVVENKVTHFILTDSEFNEETEAENGKAEKKTDAKKAATPKRTKGIGKGEVAVDAESETAESAKAPAN